MRRVHLGRAVAGCGQAPQKASGGVEMEPPSMASEDAVSPLLFAVVDAVFDARMYGAILNQDEPQDM
jgi:hypothetical protein